MLLSDDIETIAGGLKEQLTPFHYQWLCACAVYPGLRWPLTVWLGVRLAERANREPPDEDEHLPLIQLPWFRQGSIPDEMRLRLLRDLSPENREFVRAEIEALFAAARRSGDDEEGRYVLDLKRPTGSTWSRFMRQWRQKPENRDQDDAIFTHYMLGATPSDLDLELDRRLARLFGARLAGWFGWRNLAAALGAVVFAVAAWTLGGVLEENWQVEVPERQITLPRMVFLPAGTYQMGSSEKEERSSDDERPRHTVTIKQPFAIGKYEVTFAEWDACVEDGGCGGYSPDDAGWGRGDRPVINVSWDDVQAYIAWLNSKVEGSPYRLPSEAEWEYAARAGTVSAYPWGEKASHENANYGKDECCGGFASGRDKWEDGTAPVGEFSENKFKLHDMHGNVWEWVADCWHDTYDNAPPDGRVWVEVACTQRVGRGGSWYDTPQYLRSADRGWVQPGLRLFDLGFRVARTITP